MQKIYKGSTHVTCKKSRVFAVRPFATVKEIEAEKKRKEEEAAARLEKKKAKEDKAANENKEEPFKVKGKPGRPKGSKNKKTLEREEEMRKAGKTIEKRKPGRPAGAKDKKPRKKEAHS